MHGFDEFFGNLYHLNAEEEPETYYYPKDPAFKKQFGPRGVIHSWSDGKGGQKIEDTGPLNTARMPTVDEEIYAAAGKFIDKATKDKKPFFIWFNSTRMHVWTHLKKESQGRTGIGLYPDGMVEHDDMVGGLLKKLDDMGLSKDTIVVYGTNNGARPPHGRMADHAVPRREGHYLGRRFSCAHDRKMAGCDQARHHHQRNLFQEDWMPTLLAAAGEPNIVEKLKNGYKANGKTFKIHADGYNFLPYFKGEVKKGPREEIIYFGQGGELNAVRWNDWKVNFAGVEGNIATGQRIVTDWPLIVNLRADPYETMPFHSAMYLRWYADNIWLFVPVGREDQGIPDDDSEISVPGRKRYEPIGHQLYDTQGGGGASPARDAQQSAKLIVEHSHYY